ncbi:MAG: alkaline phosphatase D family protein [Candidatus Elarobacter sp.]
MNRREALKLAAAMGASLAWTPSLDAIPSFARSERRDLFPEGVASGDPHPDSVLLWTRRPPMDGDTATHLTAQIADDAAFTHIVAEAHATVRAQTDWTCRVLAAGLKPRREYWYRFIDERGNTSRVGRTITSPAAGDSAPVHFSFVSCQNNQLGACNAYRRMIFEDEKRTPAERCGFVLHLGDFVYELIWYPEDRPKGYYDRRIRDIVRYPDGEKHADFHVPTTVDGYRALYRAYLADPDLQDARARWPFVCMWDNHEFSWKGWQSQQNFGEGTVPAQTRKVAAAQAWWEYQPARVAKGSGGALNDFTAPKVVDAPLHDVDANGLGEDAGNLAAIRTLTLYRAMRYGSNVDLILTDNRSYRSEPVNDRAEMKQFRPKGFPYFDLDEAFGALDAGRTYRGGHPPATIEFDGVPLPNPNIAAAPGTILGAQQKRWFLERLRSASAPWKVWGNSIASLDWRTDLQNAPEVNGKRWPSPGYGLSTEEDWSAYRAERNEIFDSVRTNRVTGFVSLAGDRHAFTAGRLSTSLPPEKFEPVGVEFIAGSISAPGLVESSEHNIPKDHPRRALYFHDSPAGARSTINAVLRHGVKTCLVLQETNDEGQALAASNPDVAPHLTFADLAGHGYATVRAAPDALDVEFVCIERPVERATSSDGGALVYRISHRVARWAPGEEPTLERKDLEGVPPLLS